MTEPPRSTNARTCLAASSSGKRRLPQEQRDLVPIDGRHLAERARLPPCTEARDPVRSTTASASGRATCGSSTTMIARRGAGCSKTNQKSLSAGLASAGIDTRPQPRSRPFSSGIGWSLSSASAANRQRHLGPGPVDLDLNRNGGHVVRRFLPRDPQARAEARRRRWSSGAARRSRASTGFRARSRDRQAGGTGRPGSARGTRRAAPASGRRRSSSRFRAGRNRSRSRCGPPCWP